MDIHLTAHEILAYTSKSRWVFTKIEGVEVYHPTGFPFIDIKTLMDILPQYDVRQLKFAIDMLKNNGHVDVLASDDWLNIRVACVEYGEQAYEHRFYYNLYDKDRIESTENWKRRNWFLIAVFAFVVGSVIAPITVEWLKRCLWPDTIQSSKATSIPLDTTLKR